MLSIAWISCSSNAECPAGNPIGNYVDWAHDVGPRLRKHGITRVFLHNPGGQWPEVDAADHRPMRCDQWLRAEAAKLPFADRKDFREAVTVLKKHGVKEVIVYLGSPTQLMDVESQLPECTAPFLAGHEGVVSFAFDAIFHDKDWPEQWRRNSPYVKALTALRRKCRSVYSEPRMTAKHLAAGLGNLVDGTVAEVGYDENPAFAVDLAIQPGETIRSTSRGNHSSKFPEVKAWPERITRLFQTEFNWGPRMDEGDG